MIRLNEIESYNFILLNVSVNYFFFILNCFVLQGYRYRRAYVATQGPLADTTEDFWRMLWEHNSTIIVMLTKLREMGRVSSLVSFFLENIYPCMRSVFFCVS